MTKWGGESDDEVDVFGDAIPQEVPVVGGASGRRSVRAFGKQSIVGDVHAGPKPARAKFIGLQVSVPHYKIMDGLKPGSKRSYVAYVVQCQGAEASWQVHKRFSEFASLHRALVSSKGHEAKKIPAFPSKLKRPLEADMALVKRRVEMLGKYIGSVWKLADAGKLRREVLEQFLQEDTHTAVATSPTARSDPAANNHVIQIFGPEDDDVFSNAGCALLDGNAEGGFIKLPEAPWTPKVTVMSTDSDHHIVLDLPGMSDSDLTVTALENGIRVSGERALDLENCNIVHNDREFGSLAIDFIVPERYAPYTSFTNRMSHGCLYITFSGSSVGSDSASVSTSSPMMSHRTDLSIPSGRRA
eukprot:TRINITY_DN9702_c0_g3_i1.p1 TRINITY_DN9702_c0_g3~~TRINITY_DN9702_c0_g3_i1.p1  ORF type:complete len:357 (+),score=99.03 TRINITY_DN9702_c0_g3_i1:170-1240(+)